MAVLNHLQMKKIIVTLPVIFFWIISMAQLPVKQWDASFGCLNTDQIFSLQQTTDGGYILGGQSKSLKGCNKSGAQVGKMDYWIVKTNSNGIKIYDKVFGGSLNDELTVIIQTADGGFIVGGTPNQELPETKRKPRMAEMTFGL